MKPMKSKILLILLMFTIPLTAGSDGTGKSVEINGFALRKFTQNNNAIVKIHDKVKLTVNHDDFFAVTYYEPYPETNKINFLSIALFKTLNGKYTKLFDKMIFDTGRPEEFGAPFLFKADKNSFVFFSRCGGQGHFCEYHIYEISDQIKQMEFEDYYSSSKIKALLKDDENLICRGHKYNFKDDSIYCEVPVYKKSDPCCCPTRGSLSFTYKFVNNAFHIKSAARLNGK